MDRFKPEDAAHTGALPVAGTAAVPVTEDEAAPGHGRPEWVDARRAELTVPGRYLAYEDSGKELLVPLAGEWTRIGRSLQAEIRFDDATVSRRHALIVCEDGGARVLDDRSLNGVFVNGRRVDWSPLADGDAITIGRHSVFFIDTATVGSAAGPAPAALTE